MAKTTHLIHHPYAPPEGFVAPQFPTYRASTVIFPNVSSMRARDWKQKSGYTYGLHGTPSSFTLEERLASIEGAKFCQLVPSGLSAIALVNLSLLKCGDEVLIPSNAYAPSLALALGELAHYGITHRLYDPLNTADLAQKISGITRLVWVEAPGSVTMEFPPLEAIVQLCRDKGVLSALDNTWGAGLAFNAFNLKAQDNTPLSVDISIQALTKYASGGGDVLMGCVCTCDESINQKIKLTHMRLGLGVASHDVETVLRSLPSMQLRYTAQDLTAKSLANTLNKREEVVQVLHPAIQNSPGHVNWLNSCGNTRLAASIFSVIFSPNYSQDQVDLFCDSLKYFKIGYSWGGHISLVVPYDLKVIRPELFNGIDQKADGQQGQALSADSDVKGSKVVLKPGHLVRLCIGLEDAEDLTSDLEQALQIAFHNS